MSKTEKPRFKDYADAIRKAVMEKMHEDGRMPIANAAMVLRVMAEMPEIQNYLREHYKHDKPVKILRLICSHEIEQNINSIDRKLRRREPNTSVFDDDEILPDDTVQAIKASAMDLHDPTKLEKVPKPDTKFLDEWFETIAQTDRQRHAFGKNPRKLTAVFDDLLYEEMSHLWGGLELNRQKEEKKSGKHR